MNGCIYRTADNKCEFWSDHGKGIVSYCDFDDCEEKKPSHADRIRSMTDEELAEFLNCHNFCARNFDCEKGKRPCKECNLDWMRTEVTE